MLPFILQFAVLLLLARLLGMLSRRFGQPAILGELMTGLLLGPSLLGRFFPHLFQDFFPDNTLTHILLEWMNNVGMFLILFFAGQKIDLKILKTLVRPITWISIFGTLVPFLSGYFLADSLPQEFRGGSFPNPLFAIFLGALMSISAIPVIARILMDLKINRERIGIVILGSGVLQDLVAFAIFSFVISRALGRAEGLPLTLYLVFGAFLLGLIFAHIGLPPVFSRPLRTGMEKIFAPVFFACVGLKVDIWAIHHWDFFIFFLIVALAGKICGSLMGGWLAHFSFLESLTVGIGISVRGGMEMIAAWIGFSMGLINHALYSMIVLMALVTSLLAPPLLSLIGKKRTGLA